MLAVLDTAVEKVRKANYRNRVLGLLFLLMIITYLDRVSISVARPRMQERWAIASVRGGFWRESCCGGSGSLH